MPPQVGEVSLVFWVVEKQTAPGVWGIVRTIMPGVTAAQQQQIAVAQMNGWLSAIPHWIMRVREMPQDWRPRSYA